LNFPNQSQTSIFEIFSKFQSVPHHAFLQHSTIPELLGCELNDEGYLRVNPAQKTNIQGIFACGDNSTRMRTVANAVAMGTTAGMMVNKELIEDDF